MLVGEGVHIPCPGVNGTAMHGASVSVHLVFSQLQCCSVETCQCCSSPGLEMFRTLVQTFVYATA